MSIYTYVFHIHMYVYVLSRGMPMFDVHTYMYVCIYVSSLLGYLINRQVLNGAVFVCPIREVSVREIQKYDMLRREQKRVK